MANHRTHELVDSVEALGKAFANVREAQKEFATLSDATLISYNCGHYIHQFKSDEMSTEIVKFIKALNR